MILDRYILKLWLPPFLGFFFVITALLLVGRALRAIQAFGNSPIDGQILIEMLWSILPYFFTLTVPFAFFFALLKVFSSLQGTSEKDALLAAGISPFRLLRSTAILSVIFWIFLTWTSMEWMPSGQRNFFSLYNAIYKTIGVPEFAPQQFTSVFKDFTVYHSGKDGQGNMKHFMLEDKRSKPSSIYLAKLAKVQKYKELIILEMKDGIHLEGQGLEQRATLFSTFSLSLQMPGMDSDQVQTGKNTIARMMGMQELSEAMLESPSNTALSAEWHRRWLLPTTILILFLFAYPLAQSEKRSGKSKHWVWGVGLLLLVYNVQVILYKQVSIGKFDWWVMWLGQLFFIVAAIFLLRFVSKHNHLHLDKILPKLRFRKQERLN